MKKNIINIAITFIVTLLVFLGVGYVQTEPTLLEGKLELTPNNILPGTSVTFAFNVKNIGNTPSPEGEAFIRYALIQPLSKQSSTPIFKTERQKLPAIESGKEATISFEASQKLPSVIDFIRDDWLLYEYQVVLIRDNKEKVILTMPLTLSAHYYPVFRDERSLIEIPQ